MTTDSIPSRSRGDWVPQGKPPPSTIAARRKAGECPSGGRHRVADSRLKSLSADMGRAHIRQPSALWVFFLVDEAGKSLLKAATPALAAQVQGCSRCTSARGRITASLSEAPYGQAGAHHRRPGGQRAHPDSAHCRGDSISAQANGVIRETSCHRRRCHPSSK